MISRAYVTLLLTAAYVLMVPTIGKYAFFNNPILATNLFTLITYALYKRWQRYAGEVNVLLLHAVFRLLTVAQNLKEEYFSGSDSVNDMQRRRNRKLVRCAIFFIMAQNCITPKSHFIWAHSLLAFKFLLDLMTYVKKEMKKRQQEAEQESTLPNFPESEVQPTVIAREEPTHRKADRFYIGLQAFKATFIVSVFLYQALYVNSIYLAVTVVYFILVQQYALGPLTLTLEKFNLDCLEGLEKYYISALLGFSEVMFAMFIMMWVLMCGHQMLMLVALYTNIYASTRDVLRHALRAAFAEWTLLARFQRATREELTQLDDVCAVCLSNMHTARKTPCQHFFHGHCLRQCIKEKPLCPICAKKLFPVS